MTERLYSDLAGQDWHRHGVFAGPAWLDWLRAAGFEPHVEQLSPEIEPDWHAFVAKRPPG